MSQKFPLDTCPTLKNGKTLCDLWDILRKYDLDPCGHNIGLMSAEIALFIGFINNDVTIEFKDGLSKNGK